MASCSASLGVIFHIPVLVPTSCCMYHLTIHLSKYSPLFTPHYILHPHFCTLDPLCAHTGLLHPGSLCSPLLIDHDRLLVHPFWLQELVVPTRYLISYKVVLRPIGSCRPSTLFYSLYTSPLSLLRLFSPLRSLFSRVGNTVNNIQTIFMFSSSNHCLTVEAQALIKEDW